jgi:hypothetical protein
MNDHNEYEFEVEMVATVTVRAQSESRAREVIFSVLGSPNAHEIALTNANNSILDLDASMVAVDFMINPNSVELITGQHTASNAMRPTGSSLQ